MSEKSVRPHLSQRQAAADCINQALEKSDIAEICHAIAAATHLYNISDLAQISGLARPTIHRAFAGEPSRPFSMFSMRWASGCIAASGLSRTGDALDSSLPLRWHHGLLGPRPTSRWRPHRAHEG